MKSYGCYTAILAHNIWVGANNAILPLAIYRGEEILMLMHMAANVAI